MMLNPEKMEALLHALLSPEELGYAVSAEVRDRARVALGRARVETSPDSRSKPFNDHAVDDFAGEMKRKLETKRLQGRFGWEHSDSCTAEELSLMLATHILKGDPVDVANFAMMLHQRGERITFQEPPAYPAISVFKPLLPPRGHFVSAHSHPSGKEYLVQTFEGAHGSFPLFDLESRN